MPTETEELKLRITLDDQASAQLQRVRHELSQMGSGPVGSGLKNVTDKTNDAEKAFVRLTRSTLGIGQGLLDVAKILGPIPAAVGLLTIGIERHMRKMKELAAAGTEMGNIARTAMMSVGALKNIQEQLEQVGVNANDSAAMMANMNRAIQDAIRPASEVHRQLMQLAGPRFAAEMETNISKLQRARTEVEKGNIVRHMAMDAYFHALEEHQSEAFARDLERRTYQILQAEKLQALDKDLTEGSALRAANRTAEAKTQREINAELTVEEQHRRRIWEIIQNSFRPVFN